jgi:uncharacterized protein (UPF0335 family)
MKNQENRDVYKRNINYFVEKLADLEEQKQEIQLDFAAIIKRAQIETGRNITEIKKALRESRKKRAKEENRLTKDNAFVQLLADVHFCS